MLRRPALIVAVFLLPWAGPARAAPGECRVIDVRMKPSERLQIVVWLEHTTLGYVDTLYLTDGVGRRGLGNRPGRLDFNSGPRWPYGRRESIFPVWSHRHGLSFPSLWFQNSDDNNLSHPFGQSSQEAFYCRPLLPTEPAWDTGSCASTIFTDKGHFDGNRPDSRYPPREDIDRVDGVDDVSVAMFDQLNPFDMVSGATPIADTPFTVTWPIPPELAEGDYEVWVEVAREFDHNATYSATAYPSPLNIPWSEYGLPYRGQPSVVYRVPLHIGTTVEQNLTLDYSGYGDPGTQVVGSNPVIFDFDGDVRPPDATITTSVPGSGGARLLIDTQGTMTFRVLAEARPVFDDAPPGQATELEVVEVDQRSATLRFVAPGDDGMTGKVSGYQVRYRAVDPIDDDNFLDSSPVAQAIEPGEPGQIQVFDVDGLLPQTIYYVAVRAYDDCKNYGPLAVLSFRTPERMPGEVDACFVATAAYGSLLANEVGMLRSFRDGILRQSVLGELFVETYYAVGPALSANIDQSDLLRHATRDGLAPLVELVRGLKVEE